MTETVFQETTGNETLPESWVATTLGEVCLKPQYGWTTKGSSSGSIHLLRTTDITSGSIDWSMVPFCTEEPADKEKFLLQDGDIVVSRAGSVGVSHLVKRPEKSVFASYLIRFKPLIDQKFVAYFLKSPVYWTAIAESSSGIAMLNVNAKKLQQISIPLPPLNEQRRIVEKIEELFTKLDAGVRSLEQVRAQLKSYRRSVLKAAVEGELSREWREAHGDELEPASELLERILQERREKFAGKKYKEPASPDASELPALPDRWAWMSLDQTLSEAMVNGLSVKGSDSPPGVAALKLDAMTAHGLNFARVRYLPVDSTKVENLWVQEGDFFISRGNGTLSLVGRGSTAQEPPLSVIFPDTIIRARITNVLRSAAWIPAIWQSPFIRHQIEAKAKTTAGIYKVSQADLKSIAMPLPPLEEQRFLVEEIERRLSMIDKLEATVEANLKQADGLRQSILKQAFSGKLVPQDPKDEPAGLLLERIREERQATKQKAGKKSVRAKWRNPADDQAPKLFPE